MTSRWGGVRFWLLTVPLFLLTVAFIALVGYTIYSLHLFISLPPRNALRCDRFLNSSSPDLEEYCGNRTIVMPSGLDQSCFQIRKRRYLPQEMPRSIRGTRNVFFVRVVSRDYDFVEEVLEAMYSHMHFFCFAVDVSASPVFKKRMSKLGDCVMNLLVPAQLFDTSTSEGLLAAHQACFKEFDSYEWVHAIVTAEADLPLYSSRYYSMMTRRLRLLVDINGVEFRPETIATANPKDASTQLYRSVANWLRHQGSTLIVTHATQAALYKYAMGLPNFDLTGRLGTVRREDGVCRTGRYDTDGSCIYGMEDFPQIREIKKLFVRVDPQFDFGFVQCLHEVVYHKTFFEPAAPSSQLVNAPDEEESDDQD